MLELMVASLACLCKQTSLRGRLLDFGLLRTTERIMTPRLPKPPKVCKIIAPNPYKIDEEAFILHTFGIQVFLKLEGAEILLGVTLQRRV